MGLVLAGVGGRVGGRVGGWGWFSRWGASGPPPVRGPVIRPPAGKPHGPLPYVVSLPGNLEKQSDFLRFQPDLTAPSMQASIYIPFVYTALKEGQNNNHR